MYFISFYRLNRIDRLNWTEIYNICGPPVSGSWSFRGIDWTILIVWWPVSDSLRPIHTTLLFTTPNFLMRMRYINWHFTYLGYMYLCHRTTAFITRKPSYRWQTRATRKPAKNCSNSTCLQRCRWQYRPIFICLAVVASEICEIPRNSLKIQTYGVQGHPRSSILVSIESPCKTSC